MADDSALIRLLSYAGMSPREARALLDTWPSAGPSGTPLQGAEMASRSTNSAAVATGVTDAVFDPAYDELGEQGDYLDFSSSTEIYFLANGLYYFQVAPPSIASLTTTYRGHGSARIDIAADNSVAFWYPVVDFGTAYIDFRFDNSTGGSANPPLSLSCMKFL